MRKFLSLVLLLGLAVGVTQVVRAKSTKSTKVASRTVERPFVGSSNTPIIQIGSVELTDSATTIHFEAKYHPNYWIRVAPICYLRADGVKYPVLRADSIVLGAEHYMPESGRSSFSISFAPLAAGTASFDFMEDSGDGAWGLWDVNIGGGKPIAYAPDPIFAKQKLDLEAPLEPFVTTAGTAHLKGRILGYRPMMKDIQVETNSIASNEWQQLPLKIADDGTFAIDVPLDYTRNVAFVFGKMGFNNVLLSPGMTTTVNVDLGALYRKESFLPQDPKAEPETWIYFDGPYAALNSEVCHYDMTKFWGRLEYTLDSKALANMTTMQYRDYILEKLNATISEIDSDRSLSANFKEYLRQIAAVAAVNKLSMSGYYLRNAYCEVNKVDRNGPMPADYVAPQPHDSMYYAPLRAFDFNSLNSVILGNMGSDLYYIFRDLGMSFSGDGNKNVWSQEDMIPLILEYSDIDDQQRALLKKYVAADSSEWVTLSPQISYIISGNGDVIGEYVSKKAAEGLAVFFATDRGPVLDIYRNAMVVDGFSKFKTLSPDRIAELHSATTTFPSMAGAIEAKNNEVLAKVAANKAKEAARLAAVSSGTANAGRGSGLAAIKADKEGPALGYRIHTAPDVPNEDLFYAIADMFPDNVLFVDFWATWCGPCRGAMTEAEPVKKHFEGKNVIYVYLTDPSSPDKTWRNMIPGIHGEHFMLTADQMEYLKKELGVRGIPSYVIVGRDGLRKDFRVGFSGAEWMKSAISKELE